MGFCVAMTKNGRRKRTGDAVHGDLALAHALEQARLRARCGAVDLIGEEQVAECRAGAENEIVCFLVEVVEARDVAGKQVGRELDAG